MLERTAKDENLILYRVFGGAVIQIGLRHFSFCGQKFGQYGLFRVRKSGHRPLRFDFKNSDRRLRKVDF